MSHLSRALVGALLLCACATERRQALPPHLDPSNPAAPEAPLALEREAPAREEPAAAVQRYACPMHPKVQSDRPGRCPECGMALELMPADSTAEHHHGVEP